jgi:hypothetical protein
MKLASVARVSRLGQEVTGSIPVGSTVVTCSIITS